MPGPLGPAAALVGPGAVAAAKHLAVRAATSPSVTSSTLTAVLFYWSFQKLPDWVKDDISFRNLLKNHEELSKEEFVGLFSVVEKLQKIASNIKDLDINIPQLHAAVLAFIQLSGQTKLLQVNYRQINTAGDDDATANDDNDDDKRDDQSACSSSSQLSTTITRDHLYESAGKSLELSSLRSIEIQSSLKMATFAYYEDPETLTKKLDEIDYTILHHKLVDIRPGRVAHYVAVSPTKRQAVVGLRGSTTLGDFVTDCCGHAVPLVDDHSTGDKVRVEIKAAVPNIVVAGSEDGTTEIISGHERIVLEDHDEDGDNYIRCHEGILISARNVMDEIESVLLPLIECKYRIVLCGHSLGAGTAVLVATLLRSKYPQLWKPGQIHAYAYGAPPVLDHDSAIAARSYCTSIVNNADLCSRLNISNLAVSLACLRKIQAKLVESEIIPTGPVRSVAFLNKIAEGTGGTPLMTLSEMNETMAEAHNNLALRKPEHLFVPGRVLLVYDPWIDSEIHKNFSERSISKHLKCVETSGTSPVFQRLEIDGLRGFTDHLASSYFEILGMEYDSLFETQESGGKCIFSSKQG
uniref:sn-1-specific diacylglycerol lipase n=1 Tax=Pseudo-nitzschia delicatissima TaxID=44447 RepID=A0A7S0TAJ9_9STRA|mmetsp:Transcript_1296/g.2967  ORF Transcript_1296/g.2967 Transcript_1296/m.2967 type:complete len:579 (+) Transcript_1296:105-1841(+)